MRRLLLVVCAALLLLPASLMANVTLGGSTQTCTALNTSGCIVITGGAGGPFTVTFPTTLSGATIPAGGYSFNSVGPLTFTGGSAATGSPFSSGTAGTLTLPGGTIPLLWQLLDGDGTGYTLDFNGPGNDLTLNPPVNAGAPANFAALFASGGTADMSISSGQAFEPTTSTLLFVVAGAGLLLRKRIGAA